MQETFTLTGVFFLNVTVTRNCSEEILEQRNIIYPSLTWERSSQEPAISTDITGFVHQSSVLTLLF